MLLEMGSKRKLLPAMTVGTELLRGSWCHRGAEHLVESCSGWGRLSPNSSSWLNQRWHLGQFKVSLNYKYIFALKIKCLKNQHERFLLFGFILSLGLALYLKLTLNLWTSCLCPWIAEERSKYPLGTSFSVLKNKNPISSLFYLPYYIWAWPLSKDLA